MNDISKDFDKNGMISVSVLLIIIIFVIVLPHLIYRKESYHNRETDHVYELSIISQFKNESTNFEEWLSHYTEQGVDHFYLIDDDSTDAYQPFLIPYQRKNMVTLVKSLGRHSQTKNYNYFFKDMVRKQSKWVIVCDFDEFIYPHKGNTIKDYLNRVPTDVGEIMIPWKMFGSNGHIQQPHSIRVSLVGRANYDEKKKIEGSHFNGKKYRTLSKYIVRTEALNNLSIHYAKLYRPYKCITSDGNACKTNGFACVNEEILRNSHLHCNHYAIQSWDWFQRVKMTRGSATTKKNDKVRNESYFKRYDNNEKIDNELAERVEKTNNQW